MTQDDAANGAHNGTRKPWPDVAAVFPVVLSGGSGTRLWPLSRANYPKQFIRFFEDQEHSFLQATCLRLTAARGFRPPTLLCNNEHRFLVREQLEAIGVAPRAIVLEPRGRNTAPAIAVAALHAIAETPDAVLAVMPSDHVIRDTDRFVGAVRAAARVAAGGRMVLFGIPAAEPHTGYGYIRRGGSLEGCALPAFAVDAFVEKPDEATARRYVADGGYYWNSGIFIMHARTFLDELARLEPAVLEASRRALDAARPDMAFLRLDEIAFTASPDISVDRAVMEHAPGVVVLPLDVGWSDVGSWSSLWQIADRDADGNLVQGAALLEDTRNCLVHASRAVVSTIGVENLIVVETPDAILVSDRRRSQDVAAIVRRLRESNRTQHESHVRNYRPWGFYESLNLGGRFQVKLLHVKPGAKLSLQMHHHRSEHWVVVKGTARVTRGTEQMFLQENQSCYISATEWHRLENPGKVPLEIIEVQIGTYLGEDDIVRSEDVYNRALGAE